MEPKAYGCRENKNNRESAAAKPLFLLRICAFPEFAEAIRHNTAATVQPKEVQKGVFSE